LAVYNLYFQSFIESVRRGTYCKIYYCTYLLFLCICYYNILSICYWRFFYRQNQ